jgi:hypothetical protein
MKSRKGRAESFVGITGSIGFVSPVFAALVESKEALL